MDLSVPIPLAIAFVMFLPFIKATGFQTDIQLAPALAAKFTIDHVGS